MTFSNEYAVLITGAASGIGAATARVLAREGVPLFLFDIDASGLQSVAAELSGSEVIMRAGDAASEADVTDCINEVETRFGGVAGAVLAAGMCNDAAAIQDCDEDVFDAVWNLNVRGPWIAIQKLVPGMQQRGKGSIVVISSINGIKGFPNFSPYAASKQAVAGMTKTAALDLAPLGIRVNSIHPGLVETQMMRDVEKSMDASDPSAAKESFAAIPAMKRYARPEEIAETIAFLLSEKSSYTTGAQFVVDGGFTAGLAG